MGNQQDRRRTRVPPRFALRPLLAEAYDELAAAGRTQPRVLTRIAETLSAAAAARADDELDEEVDDDAHDLGRAAVQQLASETRCAVSAGMLTPQTRR